MNKNEYQENPIEILPQDNFGDFDDIVGYANGVDNKGIVSQQDKGGTPRMDLPGSTNEFTNPSVIEASKIPQLADPEVNPWNGWSRNEYLEMLRCQHAFVSIDPPLVDATTYNMFFSDAEVVISIPQDVKMYRVTWFTLAAGTAMFAMSAQRGINIASATSGTYTGCIVNPSNQWRYCRGQSELVLKNFGSASRVFATVEFFRQL